VTARSTLPTRCWDEDCGHPKGAHHYDYDRGTYIGCTRAECRCVRYVGPLMLRTESPSGTSAHASAHASHTHAIARTPMICTRCEHADSFHVGGPCQYIVEPYERKCDCRIFLPVAPAGWEPPPGWKPWEPDADPDPDKPYGVDLVELSKAISAVEKGYLTRQAPEIVAAAKAFLEFHEAATSMSKAAKSLSRVLETTRIDDMENEDDFEEEFHAKKCPHGETGFHRFFDTADDGRIITRRCSGPLGVTIKDGAGTIRDAMTIMTEDEDLEEE